MSKLLQKTIVLIVFAVLLLACHETLLAAGQVFRGTVVETLDAGGYTYLCLEEGGVKSWAAIPQAKVEIGREVELAPGTPMGQFTSKTLGRTFEAIYFSSGLAGAGGDLPHPLPTAVAAGRMPAGHGTMMAATSGTAEAKAAREMQSIAGTVAETMDAGGYTYVRVEPEDGGKGNSAWVAIPHTRLAVGQSVAFSPGATMTNFTSKTLGRTFDAIVFSGGLR